MLLRIKIFWAFLRVHFNPRVTARAKASLSRALNIFNIIMTRPAPRALFFKKKEKRGGHMIKCLLTELGRAKYFPVRPSYSVNKYILCPRT